MQIFYWREGTALVAVFGGSLTCSPPQNPFGEFAFPARPTTWYCVSDWDADPAAQQRGVELFAWTMFVAVNWPGTLSAKDERWRASDRMGALNEPQIFPQWIDWYTHAELRRALAPVHASKPGEPPPVKRVRFTSEWRCEGSECPQSDLHGPGFVTPLAKHRDVYDQSGAPLRYEVRVNEATCAGLHGALNSPVHRPVLESVVNRPITVTHTPGQCQGRGPTGDVYTNEGATNLKLAWKVLTPEEAASGRYLRRRIEAADGCVGAGCSQLEFGLVGLHIAQRSQHYKDWVWATFEHVDNLTGAHGGASGLRDNTCDAATCCPNTSLKDPATDQCETQISREPSAPQVQALNERVQAWLAAQGSVLQHYELIGVQFRPYTPDGSKLPPLPTNLRNSTIETYHMPIAPCPSPREPCGAGPSGKPSTCLDCHAEVMHHDRTFVIEQALCNCDAPPASNRCREHVPPCSTAP